MEAEEKQPPQGTAKPSNKKRRGIGRKILRVLLILFLVMALLNAAKQGSTVWSVVYNLTTGQIDIAMGRDYEDIRTFQLPMKAR